MRRLYYVANDIETTSAISEKLHSLGIRDWNFHVLSKDAAGLYSHRLHSALPHHQRDVVRSGERWGLWGLLAGIVLGGLLHLSTYPADWLTITLIAMVGGLFGAWRGSVVGYTKENHKIARFHEDIEQGRYLIMVDVRKELKGDVIELMNLQFRRVGFGGSDSIIINPFSKTGENRAGYAPAGR